MRLNSDLHTDLHLLHGHVHFCITIASHLSRTCREHVTNDDMYPIPLATTVSGTCSRVRKTMKQKKTGRKEQRSGIYTHTWSTIHNTASTKGRVPNIDSEHCRNYQNTD